MKCRGGERGGIDWEERKGEHFVDVPVLYRIPTQPETGISHETRNG